MIAALRRTPDGLQRLAPALSPVLFFGLGIGFHFALRHRLYANAAVAILALLWAATVWQRRWAMPPAGAPAPRPRPSLDEQAERLRLGMMLDQTPVALVLSGQDGALRAVNRAARALFRADDLIVPQPPALVVAMAAELPGNRTVMRLPDWAGPGLERGYALQVALVGGAGAPMRLGVLTDIQSELQAAEAAALRQLLQLLSHELMNSLTPVASLAESAHAILVEEGADGVARAAEALEVIMRRTRGLDGFVRGYRTLARLPPPDLHLVSARALLDDAATLFRTRWGPSGVKLAVQAAPDIIMQCDAGQVSQALLNLLSNAAEATLADRAATSRNVSLAAYARGSGMEFLISDNGPGVPAGYEDRIFDPFFTGKREGDGIGLALARQIALAHGGTLRLVAGQSCGATFAMRF